MMFPIPAALLLASAIAWPQSPAPSGSGNAAPPMTQEQLLISAKAVALEGGVGYTAFYGIGLRPSSDKSRRLLEKEIRKWGRFSVVEDVSKADLVLVLLEGNRSVGEDDFVRTARLDVFPGGSPRRRGDTPLWEGNESGNSLLWTSGVPKVVGKFRAFVEGLEKTTPRVDPTRLASSSGTPAAALPASPAPLPPRPHRYTNPMEIVAHARTYTIRGYGGEGTPTFFERHLFPNLGRFDRDSATAEIRDQMQAWGRMQFVDQVSAADIVIAANQWDENAWSRYMHEVKSGMQVAEGGVAYQRGDPALWTSGTQNGNLRHLVDFLRFDVEQFESGALPVSTRIANKDYQSGAKLVESAARKKSGLERNDQFAEAILLLRRSLRADYGYAPAHIQLAAALCATRFYFDAVYEYRLALQLQPGTPDALRGLAIALGSIPDFDEAARAAQDLIHAAPGDPRSHATYGLIELWRKNYSLSADAFRKAIAIDPADALLRRNLGLALHRGRRFAEAEAAFREALRLDPDDLECKILLGANLTDEHKPQEAVLLLREVAAKNDRSASAHFQLARALAALNQYEEAIMQLQFALQDDPNSLSYRAEMAHTLARAGKHKEALAGFREIAKEHADSPSAHADLGAELLADSQFDEAEKELQTAIRLDDKCARAYFYLGRLRAARGDAEGAKTAYETARSLQPDLDEFQNQPVY